MIERMSESTSSVSNMHVVVDDNNNPNKNMTMDTTRMNQGHAKQMATTLGQEPSPMELFMEMHVRSDDRQKGVQRLIDNRAQHFVGTYNNRLNERYGNDLSTQSDSDPDLWLKAGLSGGPHRN
ncbi:hypothetical protein Peur_047978 [Populus x canadensis]